MHRFNIFPQEILLSESSVLGLPKGPRVPRCASTNMDMPLMKRAAVLEHE